MSAIAELYHTLIDVLREGDPVGHLRVWWWVITHPDLLDGPPPQVAEAGDA